jgi:hypothetical protein
MPTGKSYTAKSQADKKHTLPKTPIASPVVSGNGKLRGKAMGK